VGTASEMKQNFRAEYKSEVGVKLHLYDRKKTFRASHPQQRFDDHSGHRRKTLKWKFKKTLANVKM